MLSPNCYDVTINILFNAITEDNWMATLNPKQQNIMMQRTANENAACLRRICKRSDQPKSPAGQFVCPQFPYRDNDTIFWIFPIVPCHAFCM